MELCLFQLISSSVYILVFLTAISYMLIKNRCKFNKRTKVVLIVLAMSMALQACSSTLTEWNYQDKGDCAVYPLAYTMLA